MHAPDPYWGGPQGPGKKVVFHFNKLHKSLRKGNAPPSLTDCSYSEDEELHVVKTLRRYLELTEERRTFIEF